jgi:hypothetical protein
MNMLINKYDEVENNSEVESLIFELHSFKNKTSKVKRSTYGDRKISVPDTILSNNPFGDKKIPRKLRKKIKNFIKTVELDEKIGNKTVNIDMIKEQRDRESQIGIDTIKKRAPDENLPPTVKYIHQHPELYLKYQNLCLYYEEAKSEIGLNNIKSFLNIKNPSKLEQSIGVVLMYISAFLDTTIMLFPSKIRPWDTDFTLRTNSWTYIVTSLKKLSSKKLLNYFQVTRKEIETYPLSKRTVVELEKHMHSIPGMKFSITSANSANTNKMYIFVYKIYEIAKFLQQVFEFIQNPILPNKMNSKSKGLLPLRVSLIPMNRIRCSHFKNTCSVEPEKPKEPGFQSRFPHSLMKMNEQKRGRVEKLSTWRTMASLKFNQTKETAEKDVKLEISIGQIKTMERNGGEYIDMLQSKSTKNLLKDSKKISVVSNEWCRSKMGIQQRLKFNNVKNNKNYQTCQNESIFDYSIPKNGWVSMISNYAPSKISDVRLKFNY